ncbi:MAG: hypothetical protein J5545_01905, partial [Bacteroidaceae bacterium]|nr:hypothetical protein [Bacteroidaceae bacterium]
MNKNNMMQRVIALVLTIAALMVGQSLWAQAWTVKPYSNDTWDSKTKTLIVNWKPICGGSNNVETNYQNQWAIEYVV